MTDSPDGQILPTVIDVTQAFTQRLPSQRIIDLLARLEPGRPFPELAAEMPFRIIAFRKLIADYPAFDQTAMWLHSYDVEVQVVEVDPTSNGSPTPTPLSANTGGAFPATSTV
jgi:hypothetical protein